MGNSSQISIAACNAKDFGHDVLMRLLGGFFVLLGVGLFVAFGADEALGAVLFRWNAALLNTTQAVVQRYLLPMLWDDVLLPILEAPAWLAPGALGVALSLLGWMRARG